MFPLADALGIDATGAQMVDGTGFLVGHYVNLAPTAAGGLADRLYGRTSGGGSSGS